MSHPPAPLRSTTAGSHSQFGDLPVLDRSPLSPTAAATGMEAPSPSGVNFDSPRGPLSPASPHLVDRANRRRTVLFSPHRQHFTQPSFPGAAVPSTPAHHGHASGHLSEKDAKKRVWVPFVLRMPVMIANILLLVILAVVLEVLHKVNKDDYGWGTPRWFDKYPQIHIIWTYVPGLIAFVLIWHWTEVDRYIKLLQPYIDMSRKHVTAEKSVLLNYNEESKWVVWFKALRNHHLTPLVTNTLILLCIAISPLLSSFMYLQQPPSAFLKPISNISVIEQLGLQDPGNFVHADAAAAFLKTSSLYDVSPPPFIRFLYGAAWTSTRVALDNVTEDGIVTAHTVCLRSMAYCETVSSPTLDATSHILSGSTSNCSFSTSTQGGVGSDAAVPFGIATANCPSIKSPFSSDYSAVAFWALGGMSRNTTVVSICTPGIAVQRADVHLNATTSTLLLVDGQTPLLPSDQNSNASLSSAPFNGSALNGLFFSSASGTASTLNLNSTQFGLGQAIVNTFGKADANFRDSSAFNTAVSNSYAHYLGMLAQSLYFQPMPNAVISGKLHPLDERLFISSSVTHALTALLLVMALGGIIILIMYRRAARDLRLTAEPTTLAAAIALGGSSDISHLLNGKDTEDEMRAMLADLKFTIDPVDGRLIVQESEGGYSDFPKDYVPKSARRMSSLPGAPERFPSNEKPDSEA